MENIIAAQKADEKFARTKPLTKIETNQNIIPLITNVNNPKVKILIGNVRIINIGRIIALIIPRTKAATNAEKKLVISTPGAT